MNLVRYSKIIKIPITLYLLNIKNTSILRYENLRFYEKYIVLALKSGFQAKDLEDLKQELSKIFNIKFSFVDEFIEHYNKIGFIDYDKEKSVLTLNDSYRLEYDKKNNSIMRSCTKKSSFDFIDIVYVKNINTFFSSENFKDFLKDLNEKKEIEDKSLFIKMCKSNEQLKELLENILAGSSIRAIMDDNQFKDCNIEVFEVSINIDCLLNYAYDGQVSNLQNFLISKSMPQVEVKNFLDEIIKSHFQTDLVIPKYVKEHEVYSRINETNRIISKHEEEIFKNKEEILAKENILNSYTNKENLKKKEKNKLKKLNEELDRLKEKIVKLEQENVKLTNTQERYSFFDSMTEIVYNKYSNNNYFDYMVRQICVVTDKSIEALSIGDNENIVLDLASIRSWINKLGYAIFNYFFEEPKPINFSTYFYDKFKRIKLEEIFAKSKLNSYDFSNMEICHKLIDSCYHHGENNNKTKLNQNNINEFLAYPQQKRRDVVLSFIKLYGAIDLTEEQKKEILQKMN